MTLAALVAFLVQAQAQPTILSTVPVMGATGVSPSAAVVFTFSTGMDTALTTATFMNAFASTNCPTSAAWSAGNTVLTCTPAPPFPASTFIVWDVAGQDTNGATLGGNTSGYFITGSSGGGSGTNAITTFTVGLLYSYDQTSAGAPTLDTNSPYGFFGSTSLASNRTATAVSLTLPTGAVSNLTENPLQPWSFTLFAGTTNLTTFNSTFPSGSYVFNVQAATSNQQVTVNLPSTMAQPTAPHVTNYAAAQAVNPAQPFTLGWDAFAGGTSADYVFVEIGGVYMSPDPGQAGALTGTATGFTIPAGTLQPNSNYLSSVGFYRVVFATNATYVTTAYRATATQLSLVTSGSATVPLILTNLALSGGIFSFDVTSAAGQTLTVETNATLGGGAWQKMLTTNSPGGTVHLTQPATGSALFFRARNGS